MADLSFIEDNYQGSVEAIDLWYEAQDKQRGYLGLSACGDKCKRKLWYVHNGFFGKPFEGRLLRLFQLGNLLEDQVVADCRATGFFIRQQQREVVFTQDGVTLKGHIDGIIEGIEESPVTPHLFECKSCNRKRFDDLLKKIKTLDKWDVYRAWSETYYWQVQVYMLGLKLKRAAAFIYCKDTSRLKMVRIKLDRPGTMKKLQTVFEAITSPIEPDRACPRRDYFEAKWCDYYDRCFGIRKASSLLAGSTPPWLHKK